MKVELECAQEADPKVTDNELPSAEAGLGLPSSRKYSAAPRKALLKVYNDIHVEAQVKKLNELQMQVRWLERTDAMFQDLSWSLLLYGGTGRDLKFLLASTMNILPTPDNLCRWGNTVVDQHCKLCHQSSTLHHITGACASALHQGRYTWRRHDNVWSVLVSALSHHLSTLSTMSGPSSKPVPSNHFIAFVSAGSRNCTNVPPRRDLASENLLHQATDCVLLSDSVISKLVLPSSIEISTLRPDVVLYSHSRKVVFWLELTVCLEDRFSVSNQRKHHRYAELATQCELSGWRVHSYAVEVGVLGFIPSSLRSCLKVVGFKWNKIKTLARTCSRVAVRSNYLLWVKRNQVTFREGKLC